MSEKTHLPVVVESSTKNVLTEDGLTLLPTGKYHVSYSEISDWMDCSYRHFLKHVKKIDLDKPSIHTEYGRAIHDALEEFLLSKQMPPAEAVQRVFEESLAKLSADHSVFYEQKEIGDFNKAIPRILKDLPGFLDSEFPGWSSHAAEMALMESIEGQDNRFKGFIDSVIRVPRTKPRPVKKASVLPVATNTLPKLSDLKAALAEQMAKEEAVLNPKMVLAEPSSTENSPSTNVEGDFDYYIIDWKTTSYGWSPDKKRDFQKQLQLVLYKHFFCKIMNLPLDRVRCGFVLLKRTPRKADNTCVEFVPVSVGPKTEEKGLKVLHDMINQIRSGRNIKNRNSCRYCAYNGTTHCI